MAASACHGSNDDATNIDDVMKQSIPPHRSLGCTAGIAIRTQNDRTEKIKETVFHAVNNLRI